MGASGSSVYGASTKAADIAADVDLRGKNVYITGANTGIGFETARVLVTRGAHVIVACRDKARGEEAVARIKHDVGTGTDAGTVSLASLDLHSFASVRAAAAEFVASGRPLHCLINRAHSSESCAVRSIPGGVAYICMHFYNAVVHPSSDAGIMALPRFETTADGIEKQWGVNHVGHQLLTSLLIEPLRAGSPSRVVCVASVAHKNAHTPFLEALPPTAGSYSEWANYGDSKLSNILFARELNRRESGQGVTAYSLHPGVINTELARNNPMASVFYTVGQVFMKSIPQGAATTVFCAISNAAKPGEYHSDCRPAACRSEGTSDEIAKRLWELTEQAIGGK
jgi:retinol dehydrogenase-12